MRSLDLSVELGRTGLDVHMANSFVLNVPVEKGLEFMPSIGPKGLDAKGKLLQHIFDEIHGISLVMTLIYLESPYPCRIVNRGVLEAADLPAILSDESQELDVHLDMMTRYLLVIPLRMNFADTRAAWQPV